MPPEHALDILHLEAKEGMLDQDLLETFVAARVFEAVLKGGASEGSGGGG